MDIDEPRPEWTGAEKTRQRIFTRVPGLLSWGLLLTVLALGVIHPARAVVVLLVFNFYWLFFLGYRLIMLWAYRWRLWVERNTDWSARLLQLDGQEEAKRIVGEGKISAFLHRRRVERLRHADENLPKESQIHHLVLVPVHTESPEDLQRSLKSLETQDFSKQRIMMMLALDDEASPLLKKKVWDLHRTYAEVFMSCYISPYPAEPGGGNRRAGNLSAAARMAADILKDRGISAEDTLVSCLDPGTTMDSRFLSCLSCAYLLCTEGRQLRGFRPIPVCADGVWRTPLRKTPGMLTRPFYLAMDATASEPMGQFSRQSLSFAALEQAGYWPEGGYSEDSALYWECFIRSKGAYAVEPMYLPQEIGGNANEGTHDPYCRAWVEGGEHFALLMRGLWQTRHVSGGAACKFLLKQLSFAVWPIMGVLLIWLPSALAFSGLLAGSAYYAAPHIQRMLCLLMAGSYIGLFLLCVSVLPRPVSKSALWFGLRQICTGGIFLLLLPFFVCVPVLAAQTRRLGSSK